MFWPRRQQNDGVTIRQKGVYNIRPYGQLYSGIYVCNRNSLEILNPSYVRIVIEPPREPHIFEVDEIGIHFARVGDKVYSGHLHGGKVLYCHGQDRRGKWMTHSENNKLKRLSVPEIVETAEIEVGDIDLLIVCNPGNYGFQTNTTMYRKGRGGAVGWADGYVGFDVATDRFMASLDCEGDYQLEMPDSKKQQIIDASGKVGGTVVDVKT